MGCGTLWQTLPGFQLYGPNSWLSSQVLTNANEDPSPAPLLLPRPKKKKSPACLPACRGFQLLPVKSSWGPRGICSPSQSHRWEAGLVSAACALARPLRRAAHPSLVSLCLCRLCPFVAACCCLLSFPPPPHHHHHPTLNLFLAGNSGFSSLPPGLLQLWLLPALGGDVGLLSASASLCLWLLVFPCCVFCLFASSVS